MIGLLQTQDSAKRLGKQAYTVLVLLTDGSVSNVEETKQALASISDAPLSVVIVGVGNADFSAMQFLDDLKVPRDICQFVEFDAHKHSKQSLTSATLEEIPEQLVTYFQSKNMQPLQRIKRGGSILLDSAIFEHTGDDEEIAVSLNFDENGEVFVESGGMYDQNAYTPHNGISPFAAAAAAPRPYNPLADAAAPLQPPTFGVAAQTTFAMNAFKAPTIKPPGQYQNPPAPVAMAQPVYTGAPPPAPTFQPPGHYQNPAAPAATAQPVYAGAPHPTAPVQPVYGQPAPPVPHGQPSTPAYSQPYPVYPQQQQSFPVQLPPGVGPGMQLQVQNPTTGQFMVVNVPHGITPCGTFNVPY